MAESSIKNHSYLQELKNQFNSNIIMNWSSLHKCILILVLTIGLHFLWIGWKIYIVLTPETWQWVNIALVKSQIIVNSCSTILVLLLILFCFKLQHQKWANLVLPHIIINIFIILMLGDGFLVGIYSPAMLFSFVSISGIGLILFNRQIIYVQLALALTIYGLMIYFTYMDVLPYAPIFNQKLLEENPYDNQFWLVSMLYFIIPIMVACLILCEILLSQWRHRESLIKVLSQTDPLTNLYNRRFFTEKLDDFQKMQTLYAVILIDVDHFKTINDAYGHHFGDEALRKVALLLASQIRSTDIVARYGGEEFIIALPETTIEIAQEIAERCRLAIQNQRLEALGNENIQLTASFGIAVSSDDSNMSKVINFADQALYHAKQLGRNQVQLYKPPQ